MKFVLSGESADLKPDNGVDQILHDPQWESNTAPGLNQKLTELRGGLAHQAFCGATESHQSSAQGWSSSLIRGAP